MKRCYDNYWKGKFQNYNHCGTSVKGKDDYEYFCPYDGNLYKICGYVGTCGGIVVPEELKDRQLSLFEEGNDEDEA